jgi:homoserine O-acetyltransferase
MYPDFASKVVTIVGTPHPTERDLQAWNAELAAIEHAPGWNNGNYGPGTVFKQLTAVHNGYLWTPERAAAKPAGNRPAPGGNVPASTGGQPFSTVDWYRQLQAMTSFDLLRQGDMAALAGKIKAQLLVITSEQDRMVDPAPSKALAAQKRAQLLVLNSDCGHMAPACEADKVNEAVKAFLK